MSRVGHSREAVMVIKANEPGIAYGFWRESEWVFEIIDDKPRLIAKGKFSLHFTTEKKTVLRAISIEVVDDKSGTLPSIDSAELLDDRFKQMLRKAVTHSPFIVTGRWYEPGDVVYLKDGVPVRAPKEGKFVPGRSHFRRARKAERNWQDPTEIKRIIALYREALRTLPADSTQHQIEKWVADKSGSWSQGTVHRQLQIARNANRIKPKKRGKKRAR